MNTGLFLTGLGLFFLGLTLLTVVLLGERAVEDNIIAEHVEREIEQINLARTWRDVFTPEERAEIDEIIQYGETLKRKGGRRH